MNLIRNIQKKLLILAIFLVVGLNLFFMPVNALDFCSFFPCSTEQTQAAPGINTEIERIITVVLGLVFSAIIVFGIFLVIKAAMKIIRSEGDPGQVEEGSKIIRGVFIGIAIIFIGVIGLVLIVTIFQSGGIFNIDVQTPNGINLPFINK